MDDIIEKIKDRLESAEKLKERLEKASLEESVSIRLEQLNPLYAEIGLIVSHYYGLDKRS